MENLPPTLDTLCLLHSKWEAYQGGIWTTSELAQQNRPLSPPLCGAFPDVGRNNQGIIPIL